ncbi:type I restriction endonuclease subunit R [Thalassospira lucentensis]|uniref:type I restriction endonuclease subunit R n=1 Tax=Thalassospira lucentensis TaxID=168935 RepID=UPI0029431F52|nr:type I restriction endonuclease [Thalassospira lucentensis]WOI12647.1 type I restriction endonuclease [Thalassospira lucentensis]
MSKHKEIRFEEAIEESLLADGGYFKGDSDSFDPLFALYPRDVISFVEATQDKKWQAIKALHGPKAEDALLSALSRELGSKGALTVLRKGFKCYGKTFDLAYFAPNTGMNPEAKALYDKNELKVTRQVHFSEKTPNQTLDMVLSLNGLPVVTLEIKNAMTGQTVDHAIKQYKFDRDPNEQIFKFKERALVHFAVDTDQAFMTTRLSGGKTFFLPFNKGYENRAGNPPQDGDYRTSYLWKDILARDSLMDILARFLHLQVQERRVVTKKGIKVEKRETMIFPRFHQLDVVRELVSHSKAKGSGHNYLVQHSAGSGKSNSIAWLAHRLSSLHDGAGQAKVFNSVIVVTDRRVLDQQLQDTIYQFEHKQGVVQKIDKDTRQLTKALSSGVPIIITTIQKFPFIAQALDTMSQKGETIDIDTSNKRFAVIVDEAHSSQSGETAMELRKVLNRSGIENAIASEFLDEEENLSEEAKKELIAEMMKRPRQPNLSFFAFTATPKFKTQVIFNEPNPRTNTAPFHTYSMRQAIEEKFILDVLANYTTYKRFFGLVQQMEDDPEVPKSKAAKALSRFVSMHSYDISQKVEIIVEHFRSSTKHKIGGKAKAMVVTGSRIHAVRYKLAFDKYIQEKGYDDVRSLVAFSGDVSDPELPGHTFTEVGMNSGIKERELPEKFATDEFKVLLVAEKYQTGFDEPLLHTMYVDKRLAGVQTVQTLSRLNRMTSGKEDTFVLDFVNEPEEIYKAFKPYYEVTPPGEATDPHQLYDLQHKIEEWRLFDQSELNAFCNVWFQKHVETASADHMKLNAIIDPCVERFKKLDDEQQENCKSQLESFRRLYAFLAQVIPYQDTSLEKLYVFARFLLKKLPRRDDGGVFELDEEVTLQYYRLQKMSEGAIDLSEGEAEPLKGPTEVGSRKAEEELVPLSTLIERLNDRFGTDFTEADRLFFEQVAEAATQDATLKAAAEVNTIENFALVFDKMLEGLFIERMDGNEAIFAKLIADKDFRRIANEHLLKDVYERLSKARV